MIADIAIVFFIIACILLILIGTAGIIYLKLFVLRRWRRRIHLTDPCGYATQIVNPNEPVDLYLHTSTTLTIHVFALQDKLCKQSLTRTQTATIQPNNYDYWQGCAWEKTISLPTENLEPGLYVIQICHQNNSNKDYYMPFIIRNPKADLSIIASTNTWQAYNTFGGFCNYCFHAIPWLLKPLFIFIKFINLKWRISDRHFMPVVPLPWQRPNQALHEDLHNLFQGKNVFSHLIAGEWQLIQYLAANKITYGLFSDQDFEAGLTKNSQAIIFNTHSEYWSAQMLGRLTQYIEDDGRVVFLSGNNMYRQVQHYAKGTIVIDQRVDSKLIAELIGTGYDASGYKTFAGFKVEAHDHFCFKDLALNNGDSFATPSAQAYGASGYETDKINERSRAFQVLASGTNQAGPAYIVFKPLANKGFIFNVSSVAFTSMIQKDRTIDTMLKNIIQACLA